jgi:hypothetical protein
MIDPVLIGLGGVVVGGLIGHFSSYYIAKLNISESKKQQREHLQRTTTAALSGQVFAWHHAVGAADRAHLTADTNALMIEKFGTPTDQWVDRQDRLRQEANERIRQAVDENKALLEHLANVRLYCGGSGELAAAEKAVDSFPPVEVADLEAATTLEELNAIASQLRTNADQKLRAAVMPLRHLAATLRKGLGGGDAGPYAARARS